MVNLDLQYIKEAVIPRKLRKPNFLYFMTACFKPLISVNLLFNQYFNKKKYDLSFNGQVIYLKHILNDIFDPTNRLIEIEDTNQIQEIYLFNREEENEITYLHNTSENDPLYLRQNLEYQEGTSFTVFLPNGLSYNEVEMKSILNTYKIAGKLYKIVEL